MKVIIRGIRNAFRNLLRIISVTIILGISIGLALIMLLSYQTVVSKIASVKQSVGTTIVVNPAGSQGFQGGGEPLTTAQVGIMKQVANVTNVSETLQDRLTPVQDTTLLSAIEPGTLGNRAGRQSQRQFEGGQAPPRTFTLPIQVTAVSDSAVLASAGVKITSGTLFSSSSTGNVALIGTALATKNSLSVDSTFTAYKTVIKVVGIYDAGNQFANAGLYMPIRTLQTLSEQVGQSNSATVTVNSIDNVDTVVANLKEKLGPDKVDVISSLSAATIAIAPLENIKSISLYGLVGSLVAGSMILLMIMMMIVRERRREIGVLKAIGSSNIGIVLQFVSESLVLTVLGSVLGVILGIVLSNPVLSALLAASSSETTSTTPGGFAGRGARIAEIGGQLGGTIRSTVTSLHATIGVEILLYGFLLAIAIAIVGSALPAWFIAKVKPAEVMRAD